MRLGPRPTRDNGAAAAQNGLADTLRARTAALHREAEASGVVAEILAGSASREAYALWLRNLLPAYRALEAALERHRSGPLAAVAERNVYRGDALEADLGALCGRAFERSLPLLPAGEHYERRVSSAAAGDGARLVGHAYTRYLGDLNGGRALEVLLARSLGLGPEALAFYAYPAADLPELRRAYRAALDATGAFVDVEVVAAEALAAFRLNIALSEAVRSAAPAVPRTRLPGPAR